MKFFSQIFGDMEGTSIFSAIMLLVFLAIFIMVLIYVFRLPKKDVEDFEIMPLDKKKDISDDLSQF